MHTALLVLALMLLAPLAPVWPGADATEERLKLIGQYSFPSGQTFQGTTVGGLSGIAYDPLRNVYYAVSDDRSELQPARFYTLEIDVGPDGIGDVRVVGVTTLDSDPNSPGIQPFEKNTLDAEEILLLPNDRLIIASERDLEGRPWLRRFALDGAMELAEIPVPERFMPESRMEVDGKNVLVRGVRNNLGFEGVALAPNARSLWVANEEALAQDGPIATLQDGTVVRILRFDLTPRGWLPVAEVAYRTEKIFQAPELAGGFADNGMSAMLPAAHLWPEFDLLVMERSFSTAVGNDVWIYGVKLDGADSTLDLAALPSPYAGAVVSKTPLVRMADLGVAVDNLEGMTYGPRLPNGKPSLVVISDDNFSAFEPPQVNQFLLFELDTPAAPVGPG